MSKWLLDLLHSLLDELGTWKMIGVLLLAVAIVGGSEFFCATRFSPWEFQFSWAHVGLLAEILGASLFIRLVMRTEAEKKLRDIEKAQGEAFTQDHAWMLAIQDTMPELGYTATGLIDTPKGKRVALVLCSTRPTADAPASTVESSPPSPKEPK